VLGIRLLDKLVTPASDPAEAVPQEVDPTLSVHYQKALESASEGLHAQALEELKESLRENGAFAEAYHELGKAYRNLGDLNRAIKAFQSAIRIHPQRVETYTELGVAYDSAGNFLEAIKTYMRVLRLTPDSIETRNDLGMAYFNIGGYAEAAKAFNQALQIQESNVRAHFGLGLVYVDLRRRELAMAEHTTLQDMGEEKMASLLMDHINREFY